MIKKIFTAAVAALALAACAPEYETDNLPIIPQELKMEGEGSLFSRDDPSQATKHTYSYSLTEKGVEIESTISLSEAEGWVVGWFPLSSGLFKDLFGASVDFSDMKVFSPVGSDSWTTYEPGMWVGANGEATDWSAGHVYWFYQTFANYEGFEMKDAFCIGHNPDNAKVGEKITSKNTLNGIPFNVTITVVE